MNTTYILVVILVIAVVLVIGLYNQLITLKNQIKEALSGIDVQLKRRIDLIPNLVETVKGYAKHEKSVFENVTKARAEAMSSPAGAIEKAGAENALSNTLKTLFAVSENYPDLKANANFLDLQRELADTENKIQASRRFYNTTVMELNTQIQSFPSNVIAGLFRFHEEKFFESAAIEKEPVRVKF